jgi:hypothetical protein
MRCLPSFFATSQFDWSITQKEVKPWKLAKIEGFILSSSPLAHLYMRKEYNICQSTWVKNLKVRRYGEHVGEYIENLANILRT